MPTIRPSFRLFLLNADGRTLGDDVTTSLPDDSDGCQRDSTDAELCADFDRWLCAFMPQIPRGILTDDVADHNADGVGWDVHLPDDSGRFDVALVPVVRWTVDGYDADDERADDAPEADAFDADGAALFADPDAAEDAAGAFDLPPSAVRPVVVQPGDPGYTAEQWGIVDEDGDRVDVADFGFSDKGMDAPTPDDEDDAGPYWYDEDEAREAATACARFEASPTYAYPWAHGYARIPDDRITDAELQAAGFIVATYRGPSDDARMCGIDGGGYSFTHAHYWPLYLAVHADRRRYGWTVETEHGPAVVVRVSELDDDGNPPTSIH